MYYVYILELEDGTEYVGMTCNIEVRLTDHKNGNRNSALNSKVADLSAVVLDLNREQAAELERSLHWYQRKIARGSVVEWLVSQGISYMSGGELRNIELPILIMPIRPKRGHYNKCGHIKQDGTNYCALCHRESARKSYKKKLDHQRRKDTSRLTKKEITQ